MPLLSVQNLSKIYKNNRGIKNLDLTIDHGEVVALLGPNGAGKTTAIKGILGFVNITEGQVNINGYSMESDSEKARLRTGAMVGKPALYSHLTGFKHIKMHSGLYDHVKDKDINRVLEEVMLKPYENERIKNYSTGMKQRLAFAQAVVHEPELLLLDEPFSGLDIEGKTLLKKKIRKISRENNVGILISSHLIHDIEDIATKVCIIHDNKWLITESVENILDKYENLESYYLDQVQGKVVER